MYLVYVYDVTKKDKLIKQQFVLKRVFAKIVFKVARSGLFLKNIIVINIYYSKLKLIFT